MSGILLTQWADASAWGVPTNAAPERAVAPNFERFDGVDPLDQPAQGREPGSRPGAGQTPKSEQTYTPGPLSDTVGTLGGQPLPVSDRLHRVPGVSQLVQTPSVQQRLGVGQNNQGAAQTVALSEITGSPPVPGDLTSIIAGFG
jgi:hypothetical protein